MNNKRAGEAALHVATIILAVAAVRCTPIPLPPAEQAARLADQQEGPWLPCKRHFAVSLFASEKFVRDEQTKCDGGQAKACKNLAFVERKGCQGQPNAARADQFDGRACDLLDLGACLSRVDVCSKASGCADAERVARERRTVEVATQRCFGGVDADCDTVDGWHRDGKLGLARESGWAARTLPLECDGGREDACGPAGRHAAAHGDPLGAERIFRRFCSKKENTKAWACEGLWQLATAYENGRGVAMDEGAAVRIFHDLCRIGEARACQAATRVRNAH